MANYQANTTEVVYLNMIKFIVVSCNDNAELSCLVFLACDLWFSNCV